MLARWIATVAALLLACAQASAHVRTERAADLGTFAAGTEHTLELERAAEIASPGELPSNPKTAPPARASLENSASGENAPLTHCHAWENWSPLKKCASGVHKYLYGNGNPGSFVDPSGNCAEPVTAVICALGLATVATAAVEYARLSWSEDEDVRANAGGYAVQNTANALGVVGLTALALETGGATAPLVMGFARGGVSGLTSAYLSNAPRVYTAAENLAYAGAGMAGADMPSMTPQLPVSGALPRIMSAAGELDDLAITGAKFTDEVPAAPTLSPSMSSAQLDAALDNVEPQIGVSTAAQIVEGNGGIPTIKPVPYGTPFRQLSSKSRTALEAKVDDRTITRDEWARLQWNDRLTERRQDGIDAFWAQERAALSADLPGTRNWSPEATAAILGGGTPRGIYAHHRYSVKLYPQLANDPNNIAPSTFYEHFYKWHGGSWGNSTHGVPLRPEIPDHF